jgi:hypothetical protein
MNRRLLIILAACVALAVFGGVWIWRAQHKAPPKPQALYLVLSGDTSLWLTPCGCTTNQSGGLPRRATYLAGLKNQGEVVYGDVGGAAGGNSDYLRTKWEAILRGELLMGLRVQNIGLTEAMLGPAVLRDVGTRLGVPWVSANVRDESGNLIAPAYRVINAGGRRLAFVGLLSPRYTSKDIHVDDPRRALLTTIAEAKGKYEALIVLAYMPEGELRELAANVPEAEAVIGGPTDQPIAPEHVGATLLTSATSKGKFMAQIAVPSSPGQWAAQIVELDSHFGDDAQQVRNVGEYHAELGRRDFTSHQSGLAGTDNSVAPGSYRVAGSAACAACHVQANSIWKASSHAHAWEILLSKGNQVDPFCQQCHTTAYGLPGGFISMAQSTTLTGVGCENCHGPSQSHVQNPAVHTAFLPRDQCVRCHDGENSPGFDAEAAWQLIQHAKDASAPATSQGSDAHSARENRP